MDKKIYYLTKSKLFELEKEYDELIALEQKKATSQEVPKVFESEEINPEFVSFQEDVNFLRSRIEGLENIFASYELIKNPSQKDKFLIGIGAKVKVDVEGQKDEFTIVGTLEANPALGKISNESPVGRALLGRKVGDEVIIASPTKTTYKIQGVKYETS